MPPVPPERFTSLFRSLSSAARATFVARLWAARGWETTREGNVVVACRDAETRRIRVVDPGRFGTPTLHDVDVLVTTRDRAAVRTAADAADVSYLPPAAVRETLLYGLDRETAATLFAETFDEPLDVATEPTQSRWNRIWDTGFATWADMRDRTSGSQQLGLLVVIVLLVGVVVAGPAFAPDRQATTTVPSTTYTPGETGALGGSTTTATRSTPGITTDNGGRPAGLGETSLTNRSVLLDNHLESVRRKSRTLHVRASGPTNATLMDGRTQWNYTARIESPRQYLFAGRFVFPPSRYPPENDSTVDIVEVSVYTDGATKYRMMVEPTGTSYREYATDTTGDASGFAREVRSYYDLFLRGQRSLVDCAGTLESGECFAYRIVITGAPERFPNAESYRATAVVQDDGVISSLRVSYTLPDSDGDGDRERVRFEVTYEEFGETTVSTPDWLDEARNETSS